MRWASMRLSNRLWPSIRPAIGALLLLLTVTSFAAEGSATDEPPATCMLCAGELPVPVVALTPAWLDSVAQERSRFNVAQIDRIDSLFNAGHYGPPKQPPARRMAHLVARLTLVNAYRDLVSLAGDSTCVYEANEAVLQGINEHYSDVLLFATARLERVRLGLGHACLRYDVREPGEGVSHHGGKRLRWRVKDIDLDGVTRRLLSLDLPTATDDVVEVLLAAHHSFAVEYARVEGPPAPFEWFLVRDVEGGWLRKSGTHRPAAYMFWVTPQRAELEQDLSVAHAHIDTSGTNGPVDSPAIDLPTTPLIGVRVYIKGLRLRLPLFIPDINFDDLREIVPPMPILDMEYLNQKKQPSWLGSTSHLGFRDWKGTGPVPPLVRERFPDM